MTDPILQVLTDARRRYKAHATTQEYMRGDGGCCAVGALVRSDSGIIAHTIEQGLLPTDPGVSANVTEYGLRESWLDHGSEAGRAALALLNRVAAVRHPEITSEMITFGNEDRSRLWPYGRIEAVNQCGRVSWRGMVVGCYDQAIAEREAVLAEHHGIEPVEDLPTVKEYAHV